MRLLPHLTQELESEFVNAVRESNDGYPLHLHDMRVCYDSISEADVDTVSDALWQLDHAGQCFRCNAPLGASQYTPVGAREFMPTFCSFECYADEGEGVAAPRND